MRLKLDPTTVTVTMPTYTNQSWVVDMVCHNVSCLRDVPYAHLMVAMSESTGGLIHAEYNSGPESLGDFIRAAITANGEHIPSVIWMDRARERWTAEYRPLDMIQFYRSRADAPCMVRIERLAERLARAVESRLPDPLSMTVWFDMGDLNGLLREFIADHGYLREDHELAVPGHHLGTASPKPVPASPVPDSQFPVPGGGLS